MYSKNKKSNEILSFSGYTSPSYVFTGGRSYGKTFQTNQIVQNTHAELCPVCHGTGRYQQSFDTNLTGVKSYYEKTCHGCDGRGWVVVATVYGIR